MSIDWKHLQNGSDVRGVALSVPGGKEVILTPEACGRIAAAFVFWLSEKTGKVPADLRVGVGHDSRLTARSLTAAAIGGITACGAAAFDCGLASTPAMFMSTVFPETAFDGAVMLTASHLPRERNGMKFFVPEGGLDKPDITRLGQRRGGLLCLRGAGALGRKLLRKSIPGPRRQFSQSHPQPGGQDCYGRHPVRRPPKRSRSGPYF